MASARATWLLGATSLVSASLAAWLYVENRALHAALGAPAAPPPPPAAAPAPGPAAAPAPASPWAPRTVAIAHAAATASGAPALPEPSAESEIHARLDRRARRPDEFRA